MKKTYNCEIPSFLLNLLGREECLSCFQTPFPLHLPNFHLKFIFKYKLKFLLSKNYKKKFTQEIMGDYFNIETTLQERTKFIMKVCYFVGCKY